MTLLELLLALAGTALVAMGVAAMLAAMSYGSTSRRDMYGLVAQSKASAARITAAIRGARQVLAVNDDALVLWVSDDDGDGQPALHELRRIARDPATAEVFGYAAADDAAPTVYPLDADFDAITAALAGGATMPAELWASDVTAWDLTLDTAIPADARLVGVRLNLRQGEITEVALAAAALRNHP